MPYSSDKKRNEIYEKHLINLKTAVEKNAWDGSWYLMAYFDDGTPLGSKENEECRIDSIAQSRAIISKMGDPERSKMAMLSVVKQLVNPNDKIIKLFTPPFDKGHTNPGYIKGYLPGIRENGGQYTHAAIWALMAYANLDDGDTAHQFFSIINPINHSLNPSDTQKYKVEPYVIAADIYAVAPHIGRGGWTWYTGSASWMYRSAIESILGFELSGKILRLRPKIPKSWSQFEMIYRRKNTQYQIIVQNCDQNGPQLIPTLKLDGTILENQEIVLVDDGMRHLIQLQL